MRVLLDESRPLIPALLDAISAVILGELREIGHAT
jgi:hypothetical protein